MNRNISIEKEMEFGNLIMNNLSYSDIYEITKDIIDRLVGCRELFVDDKHLYSKYCKRIIKLRIALTYYERETMNTNLRLKYGRKGL